MKIGLVLDNPRRELDGILLIAYHLVRRGHRVFVVPMYEQGYDVPWLRADVLVVNYARSENREFLATWKDLGTQIVVLDNEGAVVPEEGTKTPYGPEPIRVNRLHEVIDHYLFWGTKQYEHFCSRSPLPVDHLHVTGCPRYDFCHPRWGEALAYERSDYVLVNTNFSAINPLFTGTVQREREKFRAAGWEMQHTDMYLTELSRVFEAYAADLRDIALWNPKLAFLIRPHPFEDPALYQQRFAGCSNVLVDGRGSVIAMIRNARCVIQLNCQTAVETLMIGKLSISLEYLNSDSLRRRYALPSSVSYPAASLSEVNNMLQDPDAYARQMPMKDLWHQHVEPLFYRNDGEAALRVSQVIDAMAPARRAPGRYAQLSKSLYGSHQRGNLRRLAQGIAANAAGSRVVTNLRSFINPRRKTKHASHDEMEQGISAIARADGCTDSWECRHVPHPVLGLPLASVEVRKRA